MPETTTTPLLTESDVEKIEARLKRWYGEDRQGFPASWQTVSDLVRDWRALRAENGDLHSELLEFKKNREASDLGYISQIETYANANERVAGENAALREQLRNATERFESEHELLTKVVTERNELREQLEQAEKERDDSLERLTAEIARRVNVNAGRMEESQKLVQSELERVVDDRLPDTCRGSYEG